MVLGTFVGWELRQVHPMLNPRIFLRPRLAAGTMSIFVQFFAFFGFIFIVLQFLQMYAAIVHWWLRSAFCHWRER